MITRDLRVGDEIEYWVNGDNPLEEPVWKHVGYVVRIEEPRTAIISGYNGPIIYKFPDGGYNKLHRIAGEKTTIRRDGDEAGVNV